MFSKKLAQIASIFSSIFLVFSFLFLLVPISVKAAPAFDVTFTKYICPPGTIIPNIDPTTNSALRPNNNGVTQGPLPSACVPGSGYQFGLVNFLNSGVEEPLPGFTDSNGNLTITVPVDFTQMGSTGIGEYQPTNLIGLLCNFDIEQISPNASYIDSIEIFTANYSAPGHCNAFNISETVSSSSSSSSSQQSSSVSSSITSSVSSSKKTHPTQKNSLVRTGGGI